MIPIKANRLMPIKNIRGFTLLEIMISLGILSLIFILIYGTFSNVHQGSQHVEKEADRYRIARLGMYYLSNDLSMVYKKISPPGTSGAGNTLVFRGEDGERLSGNNTYPNDTLVFSTVSHRSIGINSPGSDEAVVRYSLQDNVLIQELQLSNGQAVINELGGPVEGLGFRYLEKAGEAWQDHWDADNKSQKPPLAVEIELVLQKENKEAHLFKTWVDIPIR